MGKKEIFIFLSTTLLLTSSIFGQNLEKVEHGQLYRKLKEITYQEFKKNCNKEIKPISYLGGYHIYNTPSSYALSTFPEFLTTKDYEIASKFKAEVQKLADDFKNNSNGVLRKELENCTKLGYEYFQLQLKKFELLSNYYFDVYQNKVAQENVNKEISRRKTFYLDSVSEIEYQINEEINNDDEIKKLLKQKDENSSHSPIISYKFNDSKYLKLKKDAESDYQSKYSNIIAQQKIELKKLPEKNYKNNKADVLEKYRSKFNKIKEELDEKLRLINNNESYEKQAIVQKNNEIENQKKDEINSKNLEIDKKIIERKTYLEEKAKREIEDLNSKKYHFLNNIDYEINSKYKLREKLNESKRICKKGIDDIDIDVEVLKYNIRN